MDELPAAVQPEFDWFKALQGQGFTLSVAAATLDLVLTDVTPMRARSGFRQPFSLVFDGTPGQLCPQGLYRIDNASVGTLALFLVPLGRNRDGTYRYQAVFA